MIPKKIHYIWMGNKPLSKLSQACILSWKEKLNDYEIIEWNERNLDLDKISKENKFFAECRRRNLYAYMADYLRLYILYSEGGIYLDTDMLILKNLDCFLDKDIVMGHASYGKIGTGFIAVEPKSSIIKKILDFYDEEVWNCDLFIIPDVIEYVFKKNNIDFKIYDKEYFSPCAYDKNFECSDVTENTYMIHWYEGTWKLNKHVQLFLMTKHIKNPIKKRLIISKKWIGYYMRKYKVLK